MNPFILRITILTLTIISINGCALFDKSKRQKQAQLYLKIGTGHLSKGDYPNALNQLMIAAELDPKDPVIQNNLGLSYFVREKYIKAEKHLREAVKIEKKYTEARNNLGRVLIELSLHKEAIKELKIAQEDLTFPYPEKPLIYLGIAHFNLGLFREAIDAFKRSLQIKPENCAASSFLGRSHFALKEYPKAAQTLDQAINSCKNMSFDEPHYYSALSYYQIGQEKQAISRLKNLVSQFPNGKYAERAHKLLEIMK